MSRAACCGNDEGKATDGAGLPGKESPVDAIADHGVHRADGAAIAQPQREGPAASWLVDSTGAEARVAELASGVCVCAHGGRRRRDGPTEGLWKVVGAGEAEVGGGELGRDADRADVRGVEYRDR